MSDVYFIEDAVSVAVKIGKANNIFTRLKELQTGNPNPLRVIHYLKCNSPKQAFELEKDLHRKFHHLRKEGEWFHYDEKEFKQLFETTSTYNERKAKREPVKFRNLEGEVDFCLKNFPDCFFYPFHKAQITQSYEMAINMSNPFRTMEWPTYGEQRLLPWSTKTDKVFICDRKHKENIVINQHNKIKKEREEMMKPSDLSSFL